MKTATLQPARNFQDTMPRLPKRNDVAVKLDAEVARKAKIVAAARGIPIAAYISGILGPVVDRDLAEEAGRLIKPEPPARPKK
jgi:hypothetical protein